MGDGIDSATDSLIALTTIFVGKVVAKPGDKEHPWGHGRAETIATMILSFIIFLAGSEFLISSTKKLYQMIRDGSFSTANDLSFLAILASIISIAGKSILAMSQFILGKKSKSQMILANAKNMKSDIFMSLAILVGLSLSKIFKQPILDPIIAILISFCILKVACEIFCETNLELMDGNSDKELYKVLFEAVKSVNGVSNPHRARIRRIASYWDIDLDIEVDPKMTVHQAHEIAGKVERAIKESISDVYDVMVHIEPAGHANHHPKEQYGLSAESLS